jgi:foldase protein PrsA
VRRHIRFIAIVTTTLVLAACGSDGGGVAATVDGVEIQREQLQTWVRDALAANPDLVEEDVQRELLSRAIQAEIIVARAREQDVVADEAGIDAVRQSLLDELGGSAGLESALASVGYPLDFFETVFLRVEATVDALAVALLGDGSLETRTARHILVASAEEAEEVFQLLADGADFAELATERSTDTGSGSRGGDLGPAPRGAYVEEFEAAVWGASADVVLAPVETQFGFHVIEVTSIDSRAYADLDSFELRRLASAETDDLIIGAFILAEVELASGLGVWDPFTGMVTAAPLVGSSQQ